MIKEIANMNIDAELSRGNHAEEEGNIGMARVCARRACGMSISFWLQDNPRRGYGESAMNQLRSVLSDDKIPKEIKDAAERLTIRVADLSDSKFTSKPIEDARIITSYFLNIKS